MTLGVFATNEAAIQLYESLGFIKEGSRKREFKLENGTYVDDIHMYQFTE